MRLFHVVITRWPYCSDDPPERWTYDLWAKGSHLAATIALRTFTEHGHPSEGDRRGVGVGVVELTPEGA